MAYQKKGSRASLLASAGIVAALLLGAALMTGRTRVAGTLLALGARPHQIQVAVWHPLSCEEKVLQASAAYSCRQLRHPLRSLCLLWCVMCSGVLECRQWPNPPAAAICMIVPRNTVLVVCLWCASSTYYVLADTWRTAVLERAVACEIQMCLNHARLACVQWPRRRWEPTWARATRPRTRRSRSSPSRSSPRCSAPATSARCSETPVKGERGFGSPALGKPARSMHPRCRCQHAAAAFPPSERGSMLGVGVWTWISADAVDVSLCLKAPLTHACAQIPCKWCHLSTLRHEFRTRGLERQCRKDLQRFGRSCCSTSLLCCKRHEWFLKFDITNMHSKLTANTLSHGKVISIFQNHMLHQDCRYKAS